MQKMFTCLYGSRLYGTQTPTSDLDVKHVYLPTLDDMLLGRPLANKVKKTNTERNVRNAADDVDEEFLPVQVFARDFMKGQTYALELAFAVDGTHADQTLHNDLFKPFVHELRTKFLTSNVKALMGYAVNQASLYSFKGERLNVVREVLTLLRMTASAFVDHRLGDCMLEDKLFAERMTELTKKYPKYFTQSTYDVGGEVMRPCFKLLEKTLPFTDRAGHAVRVVMALEDRYGTRADSASVDNVDWKATMHAVRVVDEGLQVLAHRTLSFPFHPEYVEELLAVKRGERDLAFVTNSLDAKLDQLKTLSLTTDLPAMTVEMVAEFDTWLTGWMYRFYSL